MMTDLPVEPKTNLPDADRLSVLMAMILLAYVIAYFSNFPSTDLKIPVLGVMLSIPVNLNTIVAVLVAGMTAAGANWLFHDHPGLKGRSTLPHWLLPALTALIGGVPLSQTPNSLFWWIGLGLGGLLVVFVLIGEYIAIDTEDVRLPLAAAGLTALSFALYLVLATTLRSSGTRLSLLLPSLTVAAGLVSLRVLNLRLHGQWLVYEAGLIALLVGQGVAALYYLPLSSLRFGVMVLGLSYALVSLFINLVEEKPRRQVILTTGLMLAVSVGVALWLG